MICSELPGQIPAPKAETASDGPVDPRLDRLARLTAATFGVPLACILLERDEERRVAACTLPVEPDSLGKRFRFVRSAALRSPGGGVRGCLVIAAPEDRTFAPDEAARLEDAAAVVVDALDLADSERAYAELSHTLEQRENHLTMAMQAAKLGFWVLDVRLKRIVWSQGQDDLQGRMRTLEELMEAVLPEDRQRVQRSIMGSMNGAPDCALEYRIRVGSEVRWFTTRAAVRLDDTGRPEQIYGLTWDVTETVRARRRLARALRANEMVLDRSVDVICTIAPDECFARVSRAASEIWGREPETLIGRPFYEHLHPDDVRRTRQVAMTLSRRNRVLDIENRYVRPDGTVIDLLWSVRWSEEDGLVYAVGRDITYRKNYERKLIEAKEMAEEISRTKMTLLANISHEIRTPLTAIIGFSDVLLEDIDPAKAEFVHLIRSGGRRLMDTLNSVLDLAQIESRGLRLHPEPVDLVELASETIRFYEPTARERGLTLMLHPVPDMPAPLFADRGALDRILSNLISNALKFTPSGGVAVSVEADRERVYLSVADTGIGIGPAFLPHLFDEFRQESTGLSRRYEGSGLGLTIVHRLVEMLGGKISVESRKDAGTRFEVVIPRVAEAHRSAAITPLPRRESA